MLNLLELKYFFMNPLKSKKDVFFYLESKIDDNKRLAKKLKKTLMPVIAISIIFLALATFFSQSALLSAPVLSLLYVFIISRKIERVDKENKKLSMKIYNLLKLEEPV